MTKFKEQQLTFGARLRRLSQVASGWILALGLAIAQPDTTRDITVDPTLTGEWQGEYIIESRIVHRWKIARHQDGRYEKHLSVIDANTTHSVTQSGRWWTKEDVLYQGTDSNNNPTDAWRYTRYAETCVRLEPLMLASGKKVAPSNQFAECQQFNRQHLSAKLHLRCGTGGDLKIDAESDGKYYAITGGKRDAEPLDVRDYAVLPGFDLNRVDSASNAGELLLALVNQFQTQMSTVTRDSPTFNVSNTKSVRIYTLSQPLPKRQTMAIVGGSYVLLMAFDAADLPVGIGMILVQPIFISACVPVG